MNDRKLAVRLNGHLLGTLALDIGGQMSFAYLSEAPRALSLSMPLREEPYNNSACEAFFGGLLPESSQARQAIGRKFGINWNNTFRLLQAIGYDCAGAVSLHNPADSDSYPEWHELKTKPLSEKELANQINELPEKPLFIGIEGVRLSLAGAQDKAAVCIINNQVQLPSRGTPTTHILKPAIEAYESTLQNEYVCMRVAGRIGLNVPHVEIRKAADIPYLLIQRYDRESQGGGMIRRIHQEDFCQALGVLSANKYQSDGGPGFKTCFDLMMKTSRPALARNCLAEMMVFNFLIGNWDAHAKNFSLLHVGPTDIRLARFYDVLCLAAYPDLAQKMAMKIDRHYDPEKVRAHHWERLCKTIGFGFPALKRIVIRQTEEIPIAAEAERELLSQTEFDAALADRLLDTIKHRCNVTRQLFSR